MKNNLFIAVIAILFIGCNPDMDSDKTKACFDYSPMSDLKTSDTISFSNCSVNANYYYWDFGDGSYSYEKEPKHVFKKKQTYLVKLIVSKWAPDSYTNIQESDSISRLIDISIEVPEAYFTYTNFGTKVSFSNSSSYGINYDWDFGDGQTSTEHSPTHIYDSTGSFDVKLTVTNEYKSISTIKSIIVEDTVSLNNLKVFPGSGYCNIDLDGDGVRDFILSAEGFAGKSYRYVYSDVSSFNGYEIFYDSIDVTTTNYTHYPDYSETETLTKTYIPKIYIVGDKIINTDNTYIQKLILCDYYTQVMLSSTYNNTWIKDEVRYVGLRKIENGKTKIGWIKLKVSDYAYITMYCFKVPTETNSLLIDK